jgi:hypothetical protein
MKLIITILALTFCMTVFAQGTMSTDDTQASEAPASLSGYSEDEIDLREEEVQMQEDDFIPGVDDAPILIEEQEDPERTEKQDEDVHY